MRARGCGRRTPRTLATHRHLHLVPVVLLVLLAAPNPSTTVEPATFAVQPSPRTGAHGAGPGAVAVAPRAGATSLPVSFQQRLRACAACARAKRKCDGSRASCQLHQARQRRDVDGTRARDDGGGGLQGPAADAPEIANAATAAAYKVSAEAKQAGCLRRARFLARISSSSPSRAACPCLISLWVGRGGFSRKQRSGLHPFGQCLARFLRRPWAASIRWAAQKQTVSHVRADASGSRV
jgi:hypothetical protein